MRTESSVLSGGGPAGRRSISSRLRHGPVFSAAGHKNPHQKARLQGKRRHRARGGSLPEIRTIPLFLFRQIAALPSMTPCVAQGQPNWQSDTMDDLLRFNGAVRRDPRIEAWFAASDPHRLMAREWFERMRGCGGD